MANDRPKLGILGGMGPQATLELCQRIVDYTDADRDQDHIPTLIYNDTWIPDRTGAILGGDAQRCYEALLSGGRVLEGAGCSILAIPCNTSHYFADRLQGDIAIPLEADGKKPGIGRGAGPAGMPPGGRSGHRRHGAHRCLSAGAPGAGDRVSPAAGGDPAPGHVHHLR